MYLMRVLIFGILSLVGRPVFAGVISDAPSFASILVKILTFLLSTIGIIAILALVISGLMYITAAGDTTQIMTAKKYTIMSLVGASIALAALIIVRQVVSFL